MKKSPKFSTLILAAFTVAFAGCATVNTVEPANPAGHPNKIADKRVITSSTLNDVANVTEVIQGKAGDLAQIQVKVTNMKSAVKNITYKFQWYDANGFAVGTPQIHSLSLEGGETKPIGEIASSPKAVDWQLTLEESVGRIPTNL